MITTKTSSKTTAGLNGAKRPPQANKPRRNAARTDMANLTREVWAILLLKHDEPLVYVQETSSSLVHVRCEKSGALTIEQATPASMAFIMSDRIDFYREKPMSRAQNAAMIEVPAKPPADLVQMVLGNPLPEVPRLRGIASTPYFTKTGRLVENPGYDQESGWYLKPTINVPAVSPDPTVSELERAKGLIYEVIQDFPFEGDADRANLLAMQLVLPAREMIDGPTPIHLIEATTPGTGKSLTVQALTFPLLGINPTMRAEPKDDAEWAKVITSAMLSGERLFVVDNINSALISGTLSNASVSLRFSARELGRNRDIKGEIKWCWVMTGNNITASMEVARRIVRTRMIAPAERPWERKQDEFQIPRLMRWVETNSGLICWAALTIIQSWVARGMKDGSANLGSFERWAEVMSGILENAGIQGFLTNVSETFEDIADETASWSEFVNVWWNKHGDVLHPASDLYEILVLNDIDLDLHGDDAAARTISLGRALSLQKDKVFGEFRIVKGKGGNRRKWQLQKVIK